MKCKCRWPPLQRCVYVTCLWQFTATTATRSICETKYTRFWRQLNFFFFFFGSTAATICYNWCQIFWQLAVGRAVAGGRAHPNCFTIAQRQCRFFFLFFQENCHLSRSQRVDESLWRERLPWVPIWAAISLCSRCWFPQASSVSICLGLLHALLGLWFR